MKIAITGNIGTGKSLVTKLLKFNLPSFIAESVDEYVAEIWKDLDGTFGDGVFLKEFGTIDKKELSNLVFKDDELKVKLEKIFFVPCMEKINSLIDHADDCILEFPLLFEKTDADFMRKFDLIIDVNAPMDLMTKRVIERSGWPLEKIEAAIAAQMQLEEKDAIATAHDLNLRMIYNNKDLDWLHTQVVYYANSIKIAKIHEIHHGHHDDHEQHQVTVGIVAGSFDPITLGHEWLIQQATNVVDYLVVMVGVNPTKKGMFDEEERRQMIMGMIHKLPNYIGERICVDILPNDELLVNVAQEYGAKFIFRGIRNLSDFQYENEQNLIQRKIAPEISILYFFTPSHLTEVSSSLIKNMLHLKNWQNIAKTYVSDIVLTALENKVKK